VFALAITHLVENWVKCSWWNCTS